jgi:antitoxin Phd
MSKALKKPNRGVKPANANIAGTGERVWQVRTEDGVVMISDEQYDRLIVKSRRPKSLVQFFRESPLVGVELDLERDKDTGRDIRF